MRIRICALDLPLFGIDYSVSSLSYNSETGKYLMAAGGYDIAGAGLPRPERIDALDCVKVFTFAELEKALRFFDWIREADADAKSSFTRMLD